MVEDTGSQPVVSGSAIMEVRRITGIRWTQKAGGATAMRAEERLEEEGAGGMGGVMAERGKDGEMALGSAEKTRGMGMDAAVEDGQRSG